MVVGLFIGAIVEITGAFKFFNYDLESYNEDKLDRFIENKGEGEYELLEEAIMENDREEKKFWVFGYKKGTKKLLNKAEVFEEFDTFGDIFVIAVNKNNDPINIEWEDVEEIINMDLDDYTDTESHLEEDNEYDMNDGWIINDLDFDKEES